MTCPACADTGLVASDAFGHHEPWAAYVAAVAEHCRKLGVPEHVSGMLHPAPCACSLQAIPGAGSPGAAEVQAEAAPGLEDEGFWLDG